MENLMGRDQTRREGLEVGSLYGKPCKPTHLRIPPHLDPSGQKGGQCPKEKELPLALPFWSDFFFFLHDFMISHPYHVAI
jgi:hypothetical protein